VLEASVYAWALEKPRLADDAPGEMVGGNFGVPHRDAAYLVSHTEQGLPNILGLWIPVVSCHLIVLHASQMPISCPLDPSPCARPAPLLAYPSPATCTQGHQAIRVACA